MCDKGAPGPRIYKLTITNKVKKLKHKKFKVIFGAYSFDELCKKVDGILDKHKLTLRDIKLELANNEEAENFILKKGEDK